MSYPEAGRGSSGLAGSPPTLGMQAPSPSLSQASVLPRWSPSMTVVAAQVLD